MFSPSTQNDVVIRLRDEYLEGTMYGEKQLFLYAGNSINNNGFMGSANVAFFSSMNSIIHETPACIAAPLVNMIAKNAISLGMAGQGSQPIPVRLYAPKQLSITTKHLSVGDIMMIIEPKYGFISCRKLTLQKSTEEDPENFEIVKSWVIDDDVEIETVQK